MILNPKIFALSKKPWMAIYGKHVGSFSLYNKRTLNPGKTLGLEIKFISLQKKHFTED